MTALFYVKVLIEIAVILLIAYGIWHEEELCAWEQELWKVLKQWAKRGFKKGRGSYDKQK